MQGRVVGALYADEILVGSSDSIAVTAGIISLPILGTSEAAPLVKSFETPSGIRFSWFGEKTSRPAPTLFFFVKDMQSTLERENVAQVTRLLAKAGWISVSWIFPATGQTRNQERLGGLPVGVRE